MTIFPERPGYQDQRNKGPRQGLDYGCLNRFRDLRDFSVQGLGVMTCLRPRIRRMSIVGLGIKSAFDSLKHSNE